MKKVYLALLLAALPVFAVAQSKSFDDLRGPDEKIAVTCAGDKQLQQDNAQLKSQIAELRIVNSNWQRAVYVYQSKEADSNIAEAHKKAVADLEALNPGMKWDEQQGKLVQQVKDHGQAK